MSERAEADKSEAQRLDKWLWFARVVKSRTLAASLVVDGKVRVNRERVSKPSQAVRAGDVVTVTVHARVRVLKVLGFGARRGPPAEARLLYEELSPAATPRIGGKAQNEAASVDPPAAREPRNGRPAPQEPRASRKAER
jgi:ribosome-associated heat shock protein Hsp15